MRSTHLHLAWHSRLHLLTQFSSPPQSKKIPYSPFFPFHLKEGEEPPRKGVKSYTRGLNLASLDDFWGISELPEMTHKKYCVCIHITLLWEGGFL